MAAVDPVTFEVIRNALVAATDEMALALKRSAYSTNIKTRSDFSCAVFDADPSSIDLVVTDLKMPGTIDGLGVLGAVKSTTPGTQVILVTAFATADTALSAMKQGAYDYLTKPFKVDEIQVVVERARTEYGWQP